MANAFDQFDAPSSPANPFDQFDETKEPSKKSPASTLGYIGSRGLGGFLEGAKWLGATADELHPEQSAEIASLPSGQETANQSIYGTPAVAPPNTAARYLGTIASAAGSNPVMAAMTPGYTASSALGSEAGSDVNAATGNHLPELVARLLGGFAGGGLYGAGKSAATNALDRATTTNPLSDITSNKDVARALDQQERFSDTLIGQYQEPAQQAAEAIGPNVSRPEIGRGILSKVQDWLGAQRANASRDFSAIEAQFPEGSRVDLPTTTDLITRPSEGPALPPVANQLQTQLDKSGGTLPYTAVKQWRTEIGAALDNEPRLKPLYNALTDDMKAALRSQGGDQAVAAFEQANTGYRNAQTFIEDRLGRLGNASLPPERLSGIINNPASHVTELSDLANAGVIGRDDISAIGRAWMEKAGRNAEGIWDPVALTKSVGKLQMQSPEAVDLLFRSTPQQAAQFDALTQRAGALSATVSPLARANMPSPGLMRRAIPAAAGIAAQEVGIPGGELAAGWILGHGNGPNVNPLYVLPRQPLLSRIAPYLAPPTAGAGLSLLNPATTNGGLLGQQ